MQEFVDVDEGNPARVPPVPPQAVRVCRQLPRVLRPSFQFDTARVGRERIAPTIRRPVLVQVEAIDSLGQMKIDPFGQVPRLVAEDRADRQRYRPASAEVGGLPDKPLPTNAPGCTACERKAATRSGAVPMAPVQAGWPRRAAADDRPPR
jgi:hypothetical protein